MVSVVDICNMALSSIGKDDIQSLTDAGAEARACRRFYQPTRDALLQSYPWKFARKFEALASVDNDHSDRWAFAYQLPSDYLKVRMIAPDPLGDYGVAIPAGTVMPHMVEGQKIYCNVNTAFLVYTAKIDDPTLFTPLFVDALVAHLAVRLAMPLTRDPKVRADAYQLAVRAVEAAAMIDANEDRDRIENESAYVKYRNGYADVEGMVLNPAGRALEPNVWYDDGVWND